MTLAASHRRVPHRVETAAVSGQSPGLPRLSTVQTAGALLCSGHLAPTVTPLGTSPSRIQKTSLRSGGAKGTSITHSPLFLPYILTVMGRWTQYDEVRTP